MRIKTHPGEVLREEFLVPLDLSAHALALALRVPATRIGEIVNERRGITPTPLCGWQPTPHRIAAVPGAGPAAGSSRPSQ